MLIAAARYGLAATLEEGEARIAFRGNLGIASTRGGPLRISLEGGRLVVEARKGLLGKIRLELPLDEPGRAVAATYYAWLEAKRSRAGSLVGLLERVARRSGPDPRECPRILEGLRGVRYRRGLCTRIAVALALAVYKYRLLSGQALTPEDVEGVYVGEGLSNGVRGLALGLVSLLRRLGPGYASLEEVVEGGNLLFERYGYEPEALKIYLPVSMMLHGATRNWRVYVAALNSFSGTPRLARPCTSPGLAEAVLGGEALWARTGDGSVSCEPAHALAPGLLLYAYSPAGPRPSLAPEEDRSLKCISPGRPVCRRVCVVLEPTREGLEEALSEAAGAGGLVEIAYHRGEPVALRIDAERGPGMRVYDLGWRDPGPRELVYGVPPAARGRIPLEAPVDDVWSLARLLRLLG